MSDQEFRERVLDALERLEQKFESLETRIGLLGQGVRSK